MADALAYPFATPGWDTPVPVADGILWVRTALPFALDHINLWLIDDGDGWAVIDTGVGNAATKALWEGLLAGPLAGRPVRRLIVTHFHPDHIGQAGWLVEATGAEALMTRTEWLTAKALFHDDSPGFVDAGERLDRLAGLNEALTRERRGRGNLYRRGVRPPPPSFTRLQAGDRLRLAGSGFEVIVGEGHAPEQITLWSADRRLLIAGDQLLPRISPVIGVWPQIPDADPLGDFLGSLDRYAHLPDDVLVLPSHGLPYRGLHDRRASLRAHHEERLARTLELCRAPVTAATVMHGLFDRRPLTLQDVGFAQAETLAHLNRLVRSGEVKRTPAADGAWRFGRG
jgi:glyoxylase-like metal-dependent hydrolase (beta-lactamase superfamily II)